MWLRLSVDDTLTIRAVEAATDHSPYASARRSFRISSSCRAEDRKGFNDKVRELFGGVEGCTHLVEMIGPVATTAFQTIFPYRNRIAASAGRNPDASRKPRLLNTCHAFAEDGEIARRLWPEPSSQEKG